MQRRSLTPDAHKPAGSYRGPALFFGVLCLTLFFHTQIMTHGAFLFGNRYDAVIEAALLEHWWNVLRGLQHWSDAAIFYPHADTLGYNDGFFLYGLIYAPFRIMGADPFLAMEGVNTVVKVIGFTAFYAMFRRIVHPSSLWALTAAVLFTLNHDSLLASGHAQLFSVAFTPVAVLLLHAAWRARRRGSSKTFGLYGCLFGLFMGAWLMTSFYMAWYFIFFSILAMALYRLSRRLPPDAVPTPLPVGERTSWLMIVLVGTAALLPFLMLYIPSWRATGGHDYNDALFYAPRLADVVFLPPTHWLTALLRQCLPDVTVPTATPRFATVSLMPLLLLSFIAASVKAMRARHPRLVEVMGLAALLIICLSLRWHTISGWYAIYHLVPGASGLRVTSRFFLFLSAPIIAVALGSLATLAARWPRWLTALLIAGLIAEEIDTSPVAVFDRQQALADIQTPAPPAGCQAFYVTARADSSRDIVGSAFPHNVSAMMIAELYHLPTLNGIASFTPPGAGLNDPLAADYEARVKSYAEAHHLNHVCRLDLQSKIWQEAM